MTASTADDTLGPILPESIRRLPLAPAEGWLTVAFVVLMALTVAWSLDDAAWVLGRKEWGDFYAWGTLIAAIIGFVGAKVGWPRWTVHLVGAVAAALVLPLMVGSILVEDGGTPGELYRATAGAVVNAWIDLGVRKQAVTAEYGHYLLWIGILAWSVGQFATYAVFGHRRPLDAVIVVGVVLIANMAMTDNDQLGLLVIFSLAALCVLARTHAFDEQTTWVRRRIGDAATVRSLYLRGGAVFIAVAIFGSLTLTASASSAPLAGFWQGFDRTLIEWGRKIERFLPVGGNSRPVGFGFGDRAPIGGRWVSSNDLAVTIRVPPGDQERYYWRVQTFDHYDSSAWTWTNPFEFERSAGQRLLQGLGDDPTGAYARRELTFDVRLEVGWGEFLLSPLDPLAVDQRTRVKAVGSWFGAVEVDADAYRVTAAVPVIGPRDNGLTANRLRAAGDAYPEEVRRLYAKKADPALGADARQLLGEFIADVGTNPYDLASAMERRFSQSSEFTYDDDIVGLCGNLSTVDCFARHRTGYCMQFASTMAVLLREAGIPTRLALGYLPGQRDPTTGIETIRANAAHAWVEVFFPGFGWYSFDPTGGLSQTVGLPPGPPVTPAPSVRPTFGSVVGELPRGDERSFRPAGPGAGTTGDRNGGAEPALLAAIAILLLVGMGAAMFVAWQRGARGELTPDNVWRGIARTAGRFGFGPRPQQTVYEYAGSLGEVLPSVRPELQTVARAKVEVAYGGRELAGDALRPLRDAQRRLRLNLLRLAFHRRDRRRR